MRYLRFCLVKLGWLNVSLLAYLMFWLATPYMYEEYGTGTSLFVILLDGLVVLPMYMVAVHEVDKFVFGRNGQRILLPGEFE